MSTPDIEAINALQEPPSTSLTGPPRDVYLAAKRRIAEWDPVPPSRDADDAGR